MSTPNAKRVATAFLNGTSQRRKTAGEVRFIKDRGGDKSEWAWAAPGPSQREIGEDFTFRSKYLKPLSLCLRATLMAMGHTISAQNTFAKIKSADVSPDGSLGGKGYIQKITDMRRAYMNAVEALSALSDTLYDEIKAPHWHNDTPAGGPREREEVQEILQDAEEVREDPEGWAEDAEQQMSADVKAKPEFDGQGSSSSNRQHKQARVSDRRRLDATSSLEDGASLGRDVKALEREMELHAKQFVQKQSDWDDANRHRNLSRNSFAFNPWRAD